MLPSMASEGKMSSPHDLTPNWKQQLMALCWKNTFLMRKKHPILTVLEVLIPLLLAASLAYVRSEGKYSPASSALLWNEEEYEYEFTKWVLMWGCHYAPVTQFTQKLMETIGLESLRGYASENELYQYHMMTTYRRNVSDMDYVKPLFGVVFDGEAANSNATTVPKKLKYTIRISSEFGTAHKFSEGSRLHAGSHGATNFVGLQLLINRAFTKLALEEEKKSPTSPEKIVYYMQAMPRMVANVDSYIRTVKSSLPFISMLLFIIMCSTITKRVVSEKQSGALELMKLMGMKRRTYWLSFMLDTMLLNFFSVVLMVLILMVTFNGKNGAVIDLANPLLMVFILLVYCTAAITSLFALSSLFSKTITALLGSYFFWFLSLLLSIYSRSTELRYSTKIAAMILPNMGLFYALDAVFDREARDMHTHWTNIHQSASGAPDDLPILDVLLMLIFDIVLYSVLTWYWSEVYPGEYGQKKPRFFFLSKSYWINTREKTIIIEADPEIASPVNFEHPLVTKLTSRHPGIVIRNLWKTYPGQAGRPDVDAIKGMSLDIQKGEITALLGHNGAGKTTLMSVLTGMLAPTSGTVRVNGLDLVNNLAKIRRSVGLCTQHNLHFDELNANEHLVFYAMLKGSSYEKAQFEASKLLATVGLFAKKHAYSSKLSGGMKRKLSLAIALAGDSKVVMLDEPTSGLDPQACREIWDLLLRIRENKTILLSTHHMEEADVLGDTIAIMSSGDILCCGSSIYLKKLYGTGYHLNISRMRGNFDPNSVTDAVKQILPEAAVEYSSLKDAPGPTATMNTISFNLPATQRSKFPALLNALETSRTELGVASFGMSVTTLEEVFFKVDELHSTATDAREIISDNKHSKSLRSSICDSEPGKNSGWQLLNQQFRALVDKKIIFERHHLAMLMLQFIVPTLMILCAFSLSYMLIPQSELDEVKIPINLEIYGSKNDLRVLYAYDKSEIILANAFQNIASLVAQPLNVSGNIYDRWMDVQTNDPSSFYSNYVAAARFNKSGSVDVVVMYRKDALHSFPIAVDLASNAVLKSKVSPAYEIITWNHPLPSLENSKLTISLYESYAYSCEVKIPFIWLTIAHLGWIFSIGFSAILPLQERVRGCRQLQLIAGCPLPLIWLSYFIIDVITIAAVSIVAVAVIFPFDKLSIYTSRDASGTLLLIFFLYGLSGTVFSYLISLIKNNVSSALGFMIYIGVFAGSIINGLILIFEHGRQDKDHYTLVFVAFLRTSFGLLLPHSAFISSLTRFAATAAYNSVCRIVPPDILALACSRKELYFCCVEICEEDCFEHLDFLRASKQSDFWLTNKGSMREDLIYLITSALALSCLVLLLDSGLLSRLLEKIVSRFEEFDFEQNETKDKDVMEEVESAEECFKAMDPLLDESQVITNGNDGIPTLAVTCLSKRYGWPFIKPRFTAVQDLGFRIKQGECFGLLGANGAGKSSTFRMLTGESSISFGNANLAGCQLRRSRLQFLLNLGYCPQTEPILDELTGRESLVLYSGFRGVKPQNINSEVEKWLAGLGLMEYADQIAYTYSGGNKRKLSVALALIGGPHPLVMLDEPTSGVDPISRRQMWKAIASCQNDGQSVLLTSHSMDECEALCTRISIMVDGRLACIGPVDYLKNKFCQGFTLKIKVCSTSWVGIQQFHLPDLDLKFLQLKEDIESNFAPCQLKDEHKSLLHYHLLNAGQKWSTLFMSMELLKRKHPIIEDYTVSETTLEQLFLSFA